MPKPIYRFRMTGATLTLKIPFNCNSTATLAGFYSYFTSFLCLSDSISVWWKMTFILQGKSYVTTSTVWLSGVIIYFTDVLCLI